MAKIFYIFLLFVIPAVVLFHISGGSSFGDEKSGIIQDEEANGSLLQALTKDKTTTLGLGKDEMELETIEDGANSEQVKCIPCGAACISSRNCCRNCYCLIKWEIVIPRCVQRKPPQLPRLFLSPYDKI
ncbi:unnamed protein product [Amaranthus hypochondriacus]